MELHLITRKFSILGVCWIVRLESTRSFLIIVARNVVTLASYVIVQQLHVRNVGTSLALNTTIMLRSV